MRRIAASARCFRRGISGALPLALGAARTYIRPMTEPAREKPKLCPICRKPQDELFRPFCSKRCADVDLHRWLAGTYAVPATEDDDDEARRDGEEER
jgi:endogenous inhibitor of DNA gyrase (YacG/DUF329 family)